ncbi:hypothetical protein [Actinospica sp.]|nr:hypothetical protein [Actinospica sp.]HWG25609.1 hypothetical protein [Actinospica sp.]
MIRPHSSKPSSITLRESMAVVARTSRRWSAVRYGWRVSSSTSAPSGAA